MSLLAHLPGWLPRAAGLYLIGLVILGVSPLRRRFVEGVGLSIVWLMSTILAVGFFGWLWFGLGIVSLAALVRRALRLVHSPRTDASPRPSSISAVAAQTSASARSGDRPGPA